MNKAVSLGVLAFGVTMAVMVGQRLSDQAMAVIVGSVVGVAASVPMAAVILWLTLRQRDALQQPPAYTRETHPPRDEMPRMIVVQPPAYSAPLPAYQSSMQMPQLAAPAASYMRPAREFKIVGQEEYENEDGNAVV
jgi:hypothetical protein